MKAIKVDAINVFYKDMVVLLIKIGKINKRFLDLEILN